MDRREFLGGALASLLPLRGVAAGRDADVIVIGAGLAGLHAAMLLEELGARVLVVEARARPGGRLKSLSALPGAPEAGANVIANGYARLLDTARRLGVELAAERETGFGGADTTLLAVNGTQLPLSAWESAAVNPFREPEWRSVPPFRVAGRVVSQTNPLTSMNEWRANAAARLDRSAYAVMSEAGFNAAEIALAFERNHGYATSAHTISMLRLWQGDTWIKAQLRAGRGLYHARGGNERIPGAMAASLRGEQVYGMEVAAVRSGAERAEVVGTNGRRVTAKFVIITVPFPAARFLHFEPGLPAPQAQAIAALAYTPVFQLHFVPAAPYWEADELPVNMWTDTLAGRVFAQRRHADDDGISSLMCFVSGRSAAYLDRLPLADAARRVQDTLCRLRPAARGKLEAVSAVSWQRDPYAGGAYAAWAPGQVAAFAQTLARPAQRVHFAGEHTAQVERGMEGAMESGERAAFEVIERL